MAGAPSAFADNVDFSPDNFFGGTGTWSWGGTGTALSGSSGSLVIGATANGSSFSDLFGSTLSWTSGVAGAGISIGGGSTLYTLDATGGMGVSQDSSICSSAGCFNGTFTGGTITTTESGDTVNLNFVFGNIDPSLLADLGLNPTETSWDGTFTATLGSAASCPVTSSDAAAVQLTTGCWDSADLHLNAVPEPGSIMLFGSGLLGIAGFVRRKITRS
ncbi:MAG TPA: PEP-CTERM sorting domain-containing protein [Terriglobia bacterium]|nr:PEP-CTERM sorting domain-containing protein [Terriglobia bacterium]